MQLPIFEVNYKDFELKKITRILGCKIYYVSDGRNAWHMTWHQSYYKDACLHSSLDSAKAFCEPKRIQGSVFYLDEVPALQIDTEGISLFITQVSSEIPLAGYSANALRNVPPKGKGFIENRRDNYLVIGGSVGNALLTFERDSRFWQDLSAYNSLKFARVSHDNWNKKTCDFQWHQQKYALQATEIQKPALLDKTYLKGFTSYSIGPNYNLCWNQRISRFKQDGIIKIIQDAIL